MINVYLNGTTRNPLYQQIVEQVKQLVAKGNIQSGEHLPTVRRLAQQLQINPGTVSRAYLELERQGVVMSRRGGGTIVSTAADNPRILRQRQKYLLDIISNNVLDILSLGYSPEELEETFSLQLDRWRHESRDTEITLNSNTISIVGSDDQALNLLTYHLKQKHPELMLRISYAGSLGGLIAIQQGAADLAGIHLLDEETGEYNYPYVKHILPGMKVAIIHLANRIQGCILSRGNPKQIKGLDDLKRFDITMVNRQKGSGTRVLLDLKLHELGIQPEKIHGYDNEQDTHHSLATIIAEGNADIGLGIEAVAYSLKLDFIPLFRERYDLIIPEEKYKSKPVSYLVNMVNNLGFKKAVTQIKGYDTTQTGNTHFI